MRLAVRGEFGVGDAEMIVWRVIRTRSQLPEEAARANVGSVLKTSAAGIESFVGNCKSEGQRLFTGNPNREGVFADEMFGLKSFVENENIFAHGMPPRRDAGGRGKQKGRACHWQTRPYGLEACDVRSLQALGACGDFEFNRLAVVQRFIAFRLNRRKVDENVLAGLALDEPKALAGIEPLHCTLFFHCVSFSNLSYLRFSNASSRKSKRAASVNLQPL
jgi:hypothetical protein